MFYGCGQENNDIDAGTDAPYGYFDAHSCAWYVHGSGAQSRNLNGKKDGRD